MKKYTEYISDEKEIILNTTEESNPIRLADIYANLKDPQKVLSIGGSSYQKLAKELWKKELTREVVRNYFIKGDLYSGFVATMLWGGLGSDGKSFGHLEKAMAENNESSIIKKLKNVKEKLDNSNIQEAFESMCPNGSNKIDGVDVSYFTKLLFFMDNTSDNSRAVPLIYDKWGWHIHAAILLSQKRNVLDFFIVSANLKKRTPSNKIATSVVLPNGKKQRTKAYLNYIELMYKQSRLLSKDLFPGNLEQHLFGKARRGEYAKSAENPRNVLVAYLHEQLSPLFKNAKVELSDNDLTTKNKAKTIAKSENKAKSNSIGKSERDAEEITSELQVELKVKNHTFGIKYPKNWRDPISIHLREGDNRIEAKVPTFITSKTIRSKEIKRYIDMHGLADNQRVPAVMNISSDGTLTITILT